MADRSEEGHSRWKRNRGFLGHDSAALTVQDVQDRRQLRYELDLNSWNFRIWGVAASGFLTDSYNLFATNVILAQIAFVYWPDPGHRFQGLIINGFTLLGSIIGMLLFGFLADFYGRTRLYGIELILVLVSTIGVATSSYGYSDMNFLALFTWWRFVMGIGIGAEYPLSAVITSEWSSTHSRGKMISSVFMMQSVGQALAQLVGLWVLLGREKDYGLEAMRCGLDNLYDTECKRAVDGIWRIVIGSGAVPALLAIIFRFFLFDCGLYTLEVKNKPGAALRNTQRIYGAPPASPGRLSTQGISATNETPSPIQFSKHDLYKFFIEEGNWYYLLGTSATWFLLDVGFYGLSLDNRRILSDMWATQDPVLIGPDLSCWTSQLLGGSSTAQEQRWDLNGLPPWQTDDTLPCQNIYSVLLEQAKQYLLTVSVASVAGSLCFVLLADYIPRRRWLTTSFFVLAVLFVVTGCVYYGVVRTPAAPATVVLVAFCHFMFNLGPNTLCFIIPAEIFPTAYRCTCHGIAAAAGKLGSLVAILLVYAINSTYKDSKRQGLIFILFGSAVALGAIFSWAYMPNPQRWAVGDDGKWRLEQKTLEDLGEGREKARQQGEVLTIRGKWRAIRSRGWRRSQNSNMREAD